MKLIIYSLFAGCTILLLGARPLHYVEECSVSEIYAVKRLPSGYKVLNGSNVENGYNIKLLAPTTLKPGKYSVHITHIDDNFYEIDGDDLFLETYSCYRYIYFHEVTFNWHGSYGTIIFDE